MADNNVFNDKLQEGEKILWSGKPAAFALMDSTMKTPILLRWIISAVIGIGLLAAYIIVYAGTEVFEPLIIVVIVALFGFFIARPVMDKSSLTKKVNYCVTDKRVLLAVGHRDAYELARNGLKAAVTEGDKGCVHLALGSCAGIPATKLRSKSLSPKRGQGDSVTGFVLYNVESAVRDFFVS